MRARCRSMCALPARLAMAAMPFICMSSGRRPIFATTQGFVESIHLFKTRPDIVVPLLQRYLCFKKAPRPSFPVMQTLWQFLASKYPTAVSLKETDIANSPFIDELERTGFMDRLYASDRQ